MQGEWRGYCLTGLEITLATDMAAMALSGEWKTELSEEQVETGLISLAEKGLIQAVENEFQLEGIFGFVMRHTLAAKRWMRLYDRKSEARLIWSGTLWVAVIEDRNQWQVIPLQTALEAKEEAMNYIRKRRGHCFCQTGDRDHAGKAQRAGETWVITLEEMWQDMMKEEKEWKA